ncbi:MAG: DUF2207 domain-containing protein [bacterium]|nr:MAG: DUF2207 domain-containing protein [bacterium]
MRRKTQKRLHRNPGKHSFIAGKLNMRIIAVLVSISLASVFLITGFRTARGKSYSHPSIEQTYRFNSDGSAEVEEIRTFKFNGSFSWANLRRYTTGQYGRYSVEYHGVWDVDTNRKLPFETQSYRHAEEIKWYYQAENTTKRFLIRYRIGSAVQRYADAAQFYWKAIEDTHARIDQIAITVIPPVSSPELFKIFVHSRARPGEIDFASDFSTATVLQNKIPKDSFVELRVLLDPELFQQAAINQSQTYENLLADERRTASAARRAAIRNIAIITGAAVILAALIVAYIWAYLRYGREPRVAYNSSYEREPPRDLPPAVVPAILTQGNINLSQISNAFAAAIMECARLGYLEIHEQEEKGLIFKSTDFTYKITPKGKALLSKQPVERGRNERPLEDFEVRVLKTVIIKAGDGSMATGEDIKEWGKEMKGRKSNFLMFIKPFGTKMRKWFESKYFKLDDPRSEKAKLWFVGGSAVVFTAFLLVFAFGYRHPAFLILGFVVLASFPLSASLSRWTPEAALEEKRWKAYKKFISDFSAMNDAGPELLPLWEKHLVYATALGVADKLLSNLEMVAKEYKRTVPVAAWYVPRAGSAMAVGPGGGYASMESLSSSFSNLANLSSALSTSTSSGGGFSGGGGGGGGGGSSGAG